MSRIGRAVINIPNGVSIDVTKGNLVTVKGSKGSLSEQINPELAIKIVDGTLTVERPTDQKRHREVHGLSRSLIS